MPVGAPFGSRLFGQMLRFVGAGPATPVSVRRGYRIEAHLPKATPNLSAGCIAEVPRWLEARVREQVDEAATLTLTVSRDEPSAVYLRRPLVLKLFDVYDQHIETFVLWEREETEDTLTVQGLSLISQLAREVLPEAYRADASEGKTVLDHVRALLEYQQMEPALYVGVIDHSIKTLVRGLNVDAGSSLLHALYELHDTIGGHIWVTPDGALTWKWQRGRDMGQEFIAGHNLAHLRVRHDYSQLVTRLYYYGQAEGETHLSLKDAGQAQEYLMAPQEVLNEHGIITRVVVDTEVSDPSVLLARAERYLEEYQQAQPVYEAEALDLSHDASYGYDTLKSVGLGDVVTLYSDRIAGGSVQQHIVAIDRDLRFPHRISVVFGRMADTLLTMFRELQEQLNAPPDVGVPYAQMNGTLDGLVGLRHGSILFDRNDNLFKGLLLDPPDGRWPGANASLVPLGSINQAELEQLIQTLIDQSLAGLEIPQPGDDIQSVGDANQAGTGTAYARSNHVHKGQGIQGAVWLPWEEPL